MGNGAASKWYFPVSKRFWCSFCRGGNNESREDNEEEQEGVDANNVSKRYGKVEALKPLSLTMKPSQVTALLGHNGAGKSMPVILLSSTYALVCSTRLSAHLCKKASQHLLMCCVVSRIKLVEISM